MLDKLRSLRTQHTLIKAGSYAVLIGVIVVVFVAVIGYRDSTMGQYLLGGLIAVGIAVLIFIRPEIGAYILIILILTDLSTIFTERGLPSLNKPIVALVFVSLMANYMLSDKAKFSGLSQVEWVFLIYVMVWTISTFKAIDKDIAIERAIDIAKDFVIIFCLVHCLRDLDLWKRAANLTLIVATILAAMGVYQVLTGNFEQTFGGFALVDYQEVVTGQVSPRLGGPINASNFWGQITAAMIPLAVYRLLFAPRITAKVVSGIAILLLAFAMMNTYSRGAFLTMVLVLGLIALERRANPALIIVVGLAGFLLMALLPAGYTERIQSLLAFTQNADEAIYEDVSFTGRTAEMKAGLLMFAEHPFIGVGVGNYNANYQDYVRRIGLESRTEARDPHSLYVQILAETGLAGFVTFAALFGLVHVNLVRIRRRLKEAGYQQWMLWLTALQLSLISYMISSIFLHGHFIRYLYLLLALAISALHLSEQLLNQSDNEPSLQDAV